jgi:hypothetical protein
MARRSSLAAIMCGLVLTIGADSIEAGPFNLTLWNHDRHLRGALGGWPKVSGLYDVSSLNRTGIRTRAAQLALLLAGVVLAFEREHSLLRCFERGIDRPARREKLVETEGKQRLFALVPQ